MRHRCGPDLLAPVDTDADRIPDAWETAHGLSSADASDNLTVMPSDYTAIEEYVNSLAPLH